MRTTILLTCFQVTLFLVTGSTGLARVARIEIVERSAFAGGKEFGSVGPYERIRGRLHYAVDPSNPANARIVDIGLAKEGRLRQDLSQIKNGYIEEVVGEDPRNKSGEVLFSGDFILLKPLDLSRGNHRLLYDVNNRGNPLMLGYFNDAVNSTDPSSLEHTGNGWLMRQGYSLLWSGWNWDVEKVGERPLRIFLPIIVEKNGGRETALIQAELAVQSRDGIQVAKIAWGGSRCYPVAEGREESAVLTVRDNPDSDSVGPRRELKRENWRFARLDDSRRPVYDPTSIYLPSGFEKGKLYELLYTAKNPRVVGLGLAAIRDAISFFHFEESDDLGAPNPLLHGGGPDPEFAYIFGISQSGRLIHHMIYQGFHVDEEGRLVFEGARPHVAGGGKGGFNFRWAQTTHHPKHLEGNYFPADFFPFNYTPDGMEQYDPLAPQGRQHGDLMALAKQYSRIPRIIITNHGLEYWTRSASLSHTNVAGTADAPAHESVRIYMVNGARHGTPGILSTRTHQNAEHSIGHIDQRPVGRALLAALDEWVSYGIEPPPSQVPRVRLGELVSSSDHAKEFPRIPAYEINGVEFRGALHPGRSLRPPRADYGPRFWTMGIQDMVPPGYFGPPYETLVPAFDSDGNGIGGIRLPDISVPLGTYQGFNPRRKGTGAEDYLTAFYSSFWPFASNRRDRELKGDSRLSVEERYPSKADYVAKVKAAAQELRLGRLLLEEDEKRVVDFARSLVWPPRPIEQYPFWEVED